MAIIKKGKLLIWSSKQKEEEEEKEIEIEKIRLSRYENWLATKAFYSNNAKLDLKIGTNSGRKLAEYHWRFAIMQSSSL